jgi:hypothetical protein
MRSHSLFALLLAALLLSAAPAGAQILNGLPLINKTSGSTTLTPGCKLDYQRADNMWAEQGQPTSNPGPESLTLQPGVSKLFLTDWRFEKTRNDGSTYYGSHMRVLSNRGTHSVRLLIRGTNLEGLANLLGKATDVWYSTMPPGSGPWLVRADLTEAYCVPQ